MSRCASCGSPAHSEWACPLKETATNQRAQLVIAERTLQEAKRTRESLERHQEQAMNELAGQRMAMDRQLEIAEAKFVREQERAERQDAAAATLHELKLDARSIDREQGDDAAKWLRWRIVATRLRSIHPAEFHAAQRAEATEFTAMVTDATVRLARTIGEARIAELEVWAAVAWSRLAHLCMLNAARDYFRMVCPSSHPPVDAAEAESQFKSAEIELANLRREIPPALPAHLTDHLNSAGVQVDGEVERLLRTGAVSHPAAAAAWERLAKPPSARHAGNHFPSDTLSMWVGILSTVALLCAAPLVGLGVFDAHMPLSWSIPATAVLLLSMTVIVGTALGRRRAKMLDASDAKAERVEQQARVTNILLVLAWQTMALQNIAKLEARARATRRMADALSALQRFDTEPDNGGRLRSLLSQRPDLAEPVQRLAEAQNQEAQRSFSS